MTFARAVFACAFLMLLVGVAASRVVAQHLFGSSGPSLGSIAVESTPTPTPRAPATATSRIVRPSATTRPTPVPRHSPTATPPPTATATTGTVTLARYWVGAVASRPGETVSIGYTIDNGTGRTARLMLGASVKSARSLSWLQGAVNDPSHDVVAVVPPGISTHVRYFTMPANLRPGSYDVAWGLRDALSGQRDALVTSAAAMRVVR